MPTPASNNPLDKEKKEDVSVESIYDEKDKEYLGFLQQRLTTAKNIKAQKFSEFKDKSYYEVFNENEKIANTHLPVKKNDDDVIISAGTIEQKLDSLLSNINNLNIGLEVFAFDKDNNQLNDLATALEDVIHDTRLREPSDGGGDEEKRALRQRELLKQGTVLVQEEWLRKFEIKKKLSGEYDGKFKDSAASWSQALELVFEGPSTTLLYGPNCFPGDVTKFFMDDQPYFYVIMHKNYEEAKAKFGKFENWKYVRKGNYTPATDTSTIGNNVSSIYENKWRLSEIKDNQVEIIYYYDKSNDEFQIIINGVLMLPIGFPLSAVSPGGGYNITKQVFRVINAQFFWGQSFVSSGSVQEISKVIDEMLKLFVLKIRKSFMPSYVNTSGRFIGPKALSPGHISMGIEPGALQPIAGAEVQGVTSGEVAVFERLQDLINKNTVSDQFTGQQGKSGTTATEVMALQKQARLTLGLVVLSCTLLEKKLGYLRLWNILANWFEEIDKKVEGVNDARKMVSVFRSVTRETDIPGEGMGLRKLVVADGELPDPRMIRSEERELEKTAGKPVRKIYLNPKELKSAKLFWFIEATSKEKETSDLFKMLFKEQLNDVLTLMKLGSRPNLGSLEEEFARVWGKSKNKFFQSAQQLAPDMAGMLGGGGAPQASGRSAGEPGPMSNPASAVLGA